MSFFSIFACSADDITTLETEKIVLSEQGAYISSSSYLLGFLGELPSYAKTLETVVVLLAPLPLQLLYSLSRS